MAGEFLKSHGIDVDAEMSRIQRGSHAARMMKASSTCGDDIASVEFISNASLPRTPNNSRWDIAINAGRVSGITAHKSKDISSSSSHILNAHCALLAPSLCHPHLHIDKAYLLSHPKYSHLRIQQGTFSEAMSLTGEAKAHFEECDLLERGQRVIDESVLAGVTGMRAFVEVDAGVGRKCLDAGVKLKEGAEGRCKVQLCAFAQLPLLSASKGDADGSVIRDLMREAAGRQGVDVLGSTPYVEADRDSMERNVEWMVDLCLDHNLHLDFHLDYNIDPGTEPLVWHVLRTLKVKNWKDRTSTTKKTVVLGHCTRLALFTPAEWQLLRDEIADLPVHFVGLPTSDMFMLGRTLDVPGLISNHGFNACLGINNIGNAFTPQGSCDPLLLATQGVGLYQVGTERDAEVLFECVSTRARRAVGLDAGEGVGFGLEVKVGMEVKGLVLFGADANADGREEWRTRKSVAEVVYLHDCCRGRRTFGGGGSGE